MPTVVDYSPIGALALEQMKIEIDAELCARGKRFAEVAGYSNPQSVGVSVRNRDGVSAPPTVAVSFVWVNSKVPVGKPAAEHLLVPLAMFDQQTQRATTACRS